MKTSHLNLEWTVGDMDRLEFARRNASRMTMAEIVASLNGTQLSCTRKRMSEICNSFHVKPVTINDLMGMK